MDARVERIAKLVDNELTLLENEERVDLGRLEVLARLVRHLDMTDTAEATNPFDNLPADLLKRVLEHAPTQKDR
jgi:hypothetical protein